MQIGEVIRKYRTEKKLTQEEMANRLGVTAPAVNKWERGVSQPDIGLLSPIARLLGINPDTLLSFQESLTQEEINGIIKDLDRQFEEKTFGEVFCAAEDLIHRYPDSHWLIWQLAVILYARCSLEGEKVWEEYRDRIVGWYIRVLDSGDAQLVRNAADSLFQHYMRTQEYEKAQPYINYFSGESPECKRKQAEVYGRTGHREESYRMYEEILFQEYQMLYFVLSSLYLMALEDGETEKARMWVEKESGLAKLFEMGIYHQEACRLDLAVRERDEERTLSIVGALLGSLDGLTDFSRSEMYAHMKFGSPEPEFAGKLRKNLLKSFCGEDTLSYMKGNPDWEKLIEHEEAVCGGET